MQQRHTFNRGRRMHALGEPVGRGGPGLLMMGRCRKFSLRFFVVMCRTRPICHFIFSVQRLKCISDPLANTNNIGRSAHKNLSAMPKQQQQQHRPRQNNEPSHLQATRCVHLSETEQSHHNLMYACARSAFVACVRAFVRRPRIDHKVIGHLAAYVCQFELIRRYASHARAAWKRGELVCIRKGRAC